MNDDENTDQDSYYRFTGKQRLERAINTLYGIVQGIAADGIVTDEEVGVLIRWVSEHKQFADRHPFSEVIPAIQAIVADGVVDEDEIADLLWLTKRLSSDDHYWDTITEDMQELQGFLHGILADGRITEDELSKLSEWVDSKNHLRACWPYDELESIITYVMQDGKIDDQEHEALLQFFGEFANLQNRKSVGAQDRNSTVSGVCALDPEIEFSNRIFCFTGSSDRGTREYLIEIISGLGGQFKKGVTNTTDYLVVGAKGNPCWAYACYGRKVEDAVYRRREGQRILILHENDFWDAVEDSGLNE